MQRNFQQESSITISTSSQGLLSKHFQEAFRCFVTTACVLELCLSPLEVSALMYLDCIQII